MDAELQMREIKEMEQAGRTYELAALAECLPSGEALSRAYIALSKLHEDSASTPVEYWRAFAYARRAVSSADAGTFMWTWAQGRVAAMAADLGLYAVAEQAAFAFVGALPGQPMAQALAPWVHFALARVHASHRRYSEALVSWRLVEEGASGELAERARLHHIWTLAEAGKTSEAMAILPAVVAHVSLGHLSAATAVVYAAAGDWNSAGAHARTALKSRAAGEWRLYDTVQAAELMLILKKAAISQRRFRQAAVWREHTASLLAGWNADLIDSLLPTLPEKGGVWTDATAASSCGPAGYRRVGLLGVLG